jgi:hypothetical protein
MMHSEPAASSAHGTAVPDSERLAVPRFEPGLLAVRELPVGTDHRILKVFQRHSAFLLDDGTQVPILVQRGVPDIMVEHIRDLLEQMLAPVEGTLFAGEKPAVARAVADSGAALMIFRSNASRPAEPLASLAAAGITGVAINADGVVLPGSADETQRGRADVAESVLLRFVWDFGIARVLPEFEDAVHARAIAAAEAGLYTETDDNSDPGRLALRFLLDAYATFYGRRAHIPEATTPWPFAYAPRSREQMEERDPGTVETLEAFFPRFETRAARLWPGLRGEFSMTFDPAFPYTHRSRYLDNAELAGPGESTLRGNERDNILRGSQAANTFIGMGGDDAVDGREGLDTAVYRGRLSEYHIEIEGGVAFVIDLVEGRDGSDTLVDVERLRFADAEVSTRPPQSPPAADDVPASTDASALLERLRWGNRVALLIAPSVGDAQLAQQRELLLRDTPDLDVLDLAVVEIAGPAGSATATVLHERGTKASPTTDPLPADALRATLGIAADGFTLILLDRDGTELWRAAEPATAEAVFARFEPGSMRRVDRRARGED